MKKNILIGLLSFYFIFTSVMAVPINTNNALPAYKGELILRSQIRVTTINQDPTEMERDITVYAIPTALVYGLTAKWTLPGPYGKQP